ncbi:hypothetical protein ACVJGD_006377 [Bradyrhizobium sp. USDA 10063]
MGNIVEVSGTIMQREETQMRTERFALMMADAGDSVTVG